VLWGKGCRKGYRGNVLHDMLGWGQHDLHQIQSAAQQTPGVVVLVSARCDDSTILANRVEFVASCNLPCLLGLLCKDKDEQEQIFLVWA
jgi:hypothetical protein